MARSRTAPSARSAGAARRRRPSSSHWLGHASQLRRAHERGDGRQRVRGRAGCAAIVPRLRKSGNGSDWVLSYNRPHRDSRRASFVPETQRRLAVAASCGRSRLLSACVAGEASDRRRGPRRRVPFSKLPGVLSPSRPASQKPFRSSWPTPTLARNVPAGGWSGRFSEPVSELVKRYTASVDFDRRLAAVDIAGSLAHARMLAAVGVLSGDDLAAIERGMADDPRRNRARRVHLVARSRGRAPQHREAADRARRRRRQAAAHGALAQRPGGDRHPAVAARRDRRARGAARGAAARAARPRGRARRHDHARLHAPAGRAAGDLRPPPARLRVDARARHANASPTAAGASTGCRSAAPRSPARAIRSTATAWRASSASTAFARNSLDAVSDRDFAIEFTAAAALVMVHLSRFAEELILWMSPRFGFIALADRFCTGLVDHAAEEEPRRPGAGARQDRPRRRRIWSASSC